MPSGLNITLVPGKDAPKYDTGQELKCTHVTITEQGTQANLPIVDFVMRGADGAQYLLVLTGREVNALAAVIGGVNERNHGKREP